MRRIFGAEILPCLLALVAGVAPLSEAQILYRSGQGVQPVYEGFEQNPDGSYTMWFGYLNRNYEEQPDIPVGENNSFREAGGVAPSLPAGDAVQPDRGQPAFFYPRRQQFVFSVVVPADFVGKELIWSVTHNGQTLVAVGSLEQQNVWRIDEGVWSANRGRGIMGRTDVEYVNLPPAVRVSGVEGVVRTSQGQAVTLRAAALDDGLPGPFSGRRRQLEPLPNALPEIGGRVGDNSPKTQAIVNYEAADSTGLAITWTKYRGPGTVEFDTRVSALDPAGEEGQTAAYFSAPGTYVIRVYADDGNFTSSADVTVVVE